MKILNVHGIGLNLYAQMIVFLQWLEDERCLICQHVSHGPSQAGLTLLIYLLFPSPRLSPRVP